MTSSPDHAWMARALRLAARGLNTAHPNPRVGCVLVRDGQPVGEGWHERTGGPHAEAVALAAAGSAAAGATAYVTLEPCSHHGRTPPCAAALVAAGVSRVVLGARDPNPLVDGRGIEQLRAAGIEVVEGVLSAECAALNRGFNQRMQHGRPWLRAKLAVSLDGRTALAGGASRWITGPAARADVQRLRARSSAILTGIGTVLADDPSLNLRAAEFAGLPPPERVVLDPRLRMPATARMLALPGTTRVLAVADTEGRADELRAAGATLELLPGEAGRLDLQRVAARLGELAYNEVLVEAGPVLNGALLAAGLLDELVVYQASHVLGSGARGMFAIPDLAAMSGRHEFKLLDVRRVGPDLRLTYGRP